VSLLHVKQSSPRLGGRWPLCYRPANQAADSPRATHQPVVAPRDAFDLGSPTRNRHGAVLSTVAGLRSSSTRGRPGDGRQRRISCRVKGSRKQAERPRNAKRAMPTKAQAREALLEAQGWSLQRPARKAIERDEAKIARWSPRTGHNLCKRPNAQSLAVFHRRIGSKADPAGPADLGSQGPDPRAAPPPLPARQGPAGGGLRHQAVHPGAGRAGLPARPPAGDGHGTTWAPITPATCMPGRRPNRGWSLRTCPPTRRNSTRWRGCGPTSRAAGWPTAAALAAPS
jgi:hypothetical protein